MVLYSYRHHTNTRMIIKNFLKAAVFFTGKCYGFKDEYAGTHIIKLIKDYKEAGIKGALHVHKIHKRGFYLKSEQEFKLNDNNFKDYLSDFDYRRLAPLNGHYTIWLDDKLTFRHVFSKYRNHIPKYYFHIDSEGELLNGIDLPIEYRMMQSETEKFFELLEDKEYLLAKKAVGSLSDGIIVAKYQNEKYYINSKEMSREEVTKTLTNMRDYIIQQYIMPSKEIPSCFTTVRLIVVHNPNENYEIKYAFIYTVEPGVPSSVIDIETGKYYILNNQETFIIPKWQNIKQMVENLCIDFPELCYMGIDIGISDDNFYMFEINSMSQCQDEFPYMIENGPLKSFFEKKLCEISER